MLTTSTGIYFKFLLWKFEFYQKPILLADLGQLNFVYLSVIVYVSRTVYL